MSFGLYPFIVCLGLLFSWTLAFEDSTHDYLDLLLHDWTDEPPPNLDDCWQPTGPIANIMTASPVTFSAHSEKLLSGFEARRELSTGPIDHAIVGPSRSPLDPTIGDQQSSVHDHAINLPPPLQSEQTQRKRPRYDLEGQHDPESKLVSEPLPRSSAQPKRISENYQTTTASSSSTAMRTPHIPWTSASDAHLRFAAMKKSKFDHHPLINSETRTYIQSHPEMTKMPAYTDYSQEISTRVNTMTTRLNLAYQDNISPQGPTVRRSDSSTPWTSERNSISRDYIDYLDLHTYTSQPPKSLLPMNRIEQKLKYDRLIFDEDIFKDPCLSSEHQRRIIRINTAFKNLEVMKVLIEQDEHALWKETLNSYHFVNYDRSVDKRSNKSTGQSKSNEAKRAFWNDSCKELWKSQYDWIKFWERRSLMNLAIIDLDPHDNEPYKDLERLFTLFLFYVDMIETIIQVNFKSLISSKTDYHDHPSNFFQNSVKCFEKFRELQYHEHQQKSQTKLADHITDHDHLEKPSKLPRKRIRQIVWLYLDYWLTYSRKFDLLDFLLTIKIRLINSKVSSMIYLLILSGISIKNYQILLPISIKF
ncbi:hypothetical protein H4Q26_007657 [Puccinia striiformis f. sp. tritici PST-130]|nr:hypothetical protein H4Q26_007657 [Puccinia striiformis f. sp. tritici PST-130]